FADGQPGRRDLDARLAHAARDGIAAQPGAAIAAVALPPIGPLLQEIAHPVERLNVVDQRWLAEEADLERIGRLVARIAALALDALQKRGFLAADIGAGTAAQM